ncbi:hypothetical protein [Agrobacterium sp. NPDC090283]|uniref:hypothetical protein n=1 Tax=Agrobacterium sp. NPDC090283 TaxID=3363920 RepID=UPI00383A86DC
MAKRTRIPSRINPLVTPASEELSVTNALTSREQLSAGEIAAFTESIAHHSVIMQGFSSSFVNAFAVFNGGAFAASTAILSTVYGQAILAQYRELAVFTFGAFCSGFLLSTCLMISIYLYSERRYRHYRRVLRGEITARLPAKRNKISKLAKVLAFCMIAVTIMAIYTSLHIVGNVDYSAYLELLAQKEKALKGGLIQ